MPETRELAGLLVETIQAAAVGADPEASLRVLVDDPCPVIAETQGIIRIMPKMGEGVLGPGVNWLSHVASHRCLHR
jgi:hypothetical protein